MPVRTILLATLILTLAAPASAMARHGDGDNDVRVSGTCGNGAESKLRVRSRDHGLRIRFEVEHVRRAGRWHVTIVREGRVVFRDSLRAGRDGFEVERRVRDMSGADRVVARAVGPGGLTCAAAATVRG